MSATTKLHIQELHDGKPLTPQRVNSDSG